MARLLGQHRKHRGRNALSGLRPSSSCVGSQVTPEIGLGCAAWWNDPQWKRADTAEQKRHFVRDKLSAFNRERLMDVMYDRCRETWDREREEAWHAETVDVGDPALANGVPLPSANSETEDDSLFFAGIARCAVCDYSPEQWQAVLDQMGATPSELRDLMVRLGFERWRRG